MAKYHGKHRKEDQIAAKDQEFVEILQEINSEKAGKGTLDDTGVFSLTATQPMKRIDDDQDRA